MVNWDLYFIAPLILGATIIMLTLILKRKNFEKKWILFLVQVSLFWFAIGLISQYHINNFEIENNFINQHITLIVYAIGTLLLIILKPLATLITGKLRNRKLWMWIAIISLFIYLSLILIDLENINKAAYTTIAIFSAIFFAITISSQTVFTLYFNEQKYNRLFPIVSTFKLAIVVSISVNIGSYLYTIISSSVNQEEYYTIYKSLIFIIGLVALIVSSILCFIIPEKTINVGMFQTDIKQELELYNSKILIQLLILTTLFGIIYALSQSNIFDFLVATNNQINSTKPINNNKIEQYQNLIQPIVLILVYVFMIQKMGIKVTINIITLCLIVCTPIMMFSRNVLMISIVKSLFVIAYLIIFTTFIALSVAWNYRTAKPLPITGIVASTFLIPSFLINVILSSIQIGHAGIFDVFGSINQIENLQNVDEAKQLINSIYDIYVIIGSLIFITLSIFLIINKYCLNNVMGEWRNIKTANSQSMNLEKREIIKRITTRIRVN